MGKQRSQTERHYRENPFRYFSPHFGPNRAQRRLGARRHPVAGKLVTPPAYNVPYIRPLELEEVDDDA